MAIRPDGTADPAILSTITEAQRVPSIGVQLTIETDPERACWCGMTLTAEHRATRHPASPLTDRPAIIRRPVALNLWDTSADSIPEGWTR